jgi:hypothetical protein
MSDETFEQMLARFTPEQHRIFQGQLRERLQAVLLGQPWVADWVNEPRAEWPEHAVEWVRTRPRSVQELLVRFPPGCLVRSVPQKHLMVPAPGTLGIVLSYNEDGTVTVLQSPDSEVRVQCEADWLELAMCRQGQEPADVKRVLGWEIDTAVSD